MNRTRTNIANYGLTLTEAKEYLKVSTTLEDNTLSALITASYEQVIAECNRDFVSSSYTTTVSGSSAEFLTSQYVNNTNTGSLVNDSHGAYLYFDAPYYGDISFVVAGTSTSIPQNVKVAQLMLVAQWYEQRQPYIIGASATKLDFCIEQLLSPYKIVRP